MRILWDSESNRFLAEFAKDSWHADRIAAKDAGFRCTGPNSGWQWYSEQPGPVQALKGRTGLSITKDALEHFTAKLAEIDQSIASSRATDAVVTIPAPAGTNPSTGEPFAYLPFQRAGVAYAMGRQNVLIADEMGLGKTIQAIGVVNADTLAQRVLIVCPSSLKLNWKKEFERWDVKALSVKLVSRGRKEWPSADVIIINYEMLEKWQAELRAVDWDVMTIDECHYLKEGKTGRTQEVFGRKRARKQKRTRTIVAEDGTKVKEKYEREVDALEPLKARRRIFLTGTPIVNRPREMWPLVQSLDPTGLGGNWRRYAQRYCDGRQTNFGYDWSGSSNLVELQDIMRSCFMIRRLKKDVLKELPAKRRQIVSLEIDNATVRKIVEKERQTYEAYEQERKAAGNVEEFETPSFDILSQVRQETAIAKIPYVIQHLESMLEDGNKKLVVMAHHHKVVDSLADALREFGVVSVDGRTPDEDRQKAVDEFQTNPDIRVFVGTIRAAGVGLTLTASSTVVFAELDWVPGNVSQAEDRVHRIGQRNAVNIYHLVLENSLDERMVEIIIGKQKVIDEALDTEERNAAEPTAEPEIDPSNEPKPRVAKSKGIIWRKNDNETVVSASQSDGVRVCVAEEKPQEAQQAGPADEKQVQSIHHGLRILAELCDGAASLDAQGFNKSDSYFGKSLARASRLTPRMAGAGLRLIQKYRRQLPDELLQTLGLTKKT